MSSQLLPDASGAPLAVSYSAAGREAHNITQKSKRAFSPNHKFATSTDLQPSTTSPRMAATPPITNTPLQVPHTTVVPAPANSIPFVPPFSPSAAVHPNRAPRFHFLHRLVSPHSQLTANTPGYTLAFDPASSIGTKSAAGLGPPAFTATKEVDSNSAATNWVVNHPSGSNNKTSLLASNHLISRLAGREVAPLSSATARSESPRFRVSPDPPRSSPEFDTESIVGFHAGISTSQKQPGLPGTATNPSKALQQRPPLESSLAPPVVTSSASPSVKPPYVAPVASRVRQKRPLPDPLTTTTRTSAVQQWRQPLETIGPASLVQREHTPTTADYRVTSLGSTHPPFNISTTALGSRGMRDKFRSFWDKLSNSLSGEKKLKGAATASISGSLAGGISPYDRRYIQLLKTIGTGSFGRVYLARIVAPGEGHDRYVAVKRLDKKTLVKQRQEQHIQQERELLMYISHPFCIRLHNSFKDDYYLYMVLSLILGGEFFTYLRNQRRLPTDDVRFYSAQVALVFEYLHGHTICYRDLKPENLLIGLDGYLRITDFGFAKMVGSQRTYTLCGTPEYMAPEIIKNEGHGCAVDWWALGILIYEMHMGYPPFCHEDPKEIYTLIVQGDLKFPKGFDSDAKSLVRHLLAYYPYKRYGNLEGGAQDVKDHRFYGNANFNFGALLRQELPPPYIPQLKGEEDTSGFPKYKEAFDRPEPVTGDRDPFVGW